MKKTLIALALLVPAMAVAQEKYTNADLDIAPKRDAYTNADLADLPPLPVQAAPAVAAPAPAPPAADRLAEARQMRRQEMAFDRELIEAEIGYWEGVIREAHSGRGGINDYPRVGSDTAEARDRIVRLERMLYMLEEEMSRLR
jgi:hypothetical protein